MNSYIDGLKRTFDFSGRTSRSGYWIYAGINALVMILIMIAEWQIKGGTVEVINTLQFANYYSLLTLIASLSIAVRRMHDIGKSGWWLLVPIVSLYFVCKRSEPEANDYGDVTTLAASKDA